MPSEPSELWGLWSDSKKEYFMGLDYHPTTYKTEKSATTWANALSGYRPVRLIPAPAVSVQDVLGMLRERRCALQASADSAVTEELGFAIDEIESAIAKGGG